MVVLNETWKIPSPAHPNTHQSMQRSTTSLVVNHQEVYCNISFKVQGRLLIGTKMLVMIESASTSCSQGGIRLVNKQTSKAPSILSQSYAMPVLLQCSNMYPRGKKKMQINQSRNLWIIIILPQDAEGIEHWFCFTPVTGGNENYNLPRLCVITFINIISMISKKKCCYVHATKIWSPTNYLVFHQSTL